MDISTKIQEKINAEEMKFRECRKALDELLPAQVAHSQHAIEIAEEALLGDLVQQCSGNDGKPDETGISAHCQELAKQRLILERLPKVRPILEDRIENARTSIAHYRKLLGRVGYLENRDKVIREGTPLSRDDRERLVSMASGREREAHRLCEELQEHAKRCKRLGKVSQFEFEIQRDADHFDEEIEALNQELN